MAPLDGPSLLDHAVLLGLINREQAREVLADAEDRDIESVSRVLLRKGMLTSWQLERVRKGENTGFFYGGCKVLFHLAEGTFARVYRGMRTDSGEPVAIKVLRRRFSNDPEAVARFNKEATEGMKLRHPNIVQIVEFGNHERQHFMIMEYVEGSNLRDLLKIRQRIDPVVGLPMMLGLAKGLKYSTDLGVTHRDIKGSNILVSTNGQAKLVDFGLATIEGDGKKAASLNPRTVDYSALERTCGSQKGDPRSDIFFLGCVFYQMLTGQVAMVETETKDQLAKMLKRSFSAIKPLHEQRYAPDAELTRIIEKMMRVELPARYQTIDQVIAELEAYAKEHKKEFAAGAAQGVPEVEEDEEEIDESAIFMHSVRQEAAPAREAASTIAAAPVAAAAPAVAKEPETPAKNGDGTRQADHQEAGPAPPDTADDSEEFDELLGDTGPRNVLCVESQEFIRNAFQKALSKMGYRVILVSDPARAAARYREEPSDAVIFDADGCGPEAITALRDMHAKAGEDGVDFSALVLLSPRQASLREKLPSEGRLVVLSKPIKMKQVQDAITQLLPIG
jgi:tRNA A-37 threonylcarbamoyl transferase component Bud32/CheY-like chemotaxis protein